MHRLPALQFLRKYWICFSCLPRNLFPPTERTARTTNLPRQAAIKVRRHRAHPAPVSRIFLSLCLSSRTSSSYCAMRSSQHVGGQVHRRAMKLVRNCVEGNSSTAGQSFDQEAATAASWLAVYEAKLDSFAGRAALVGSYVDATLALACRLLHGGAILLKAIDIFPTRQPLIRTTQLSKDVR
ncbi:hypothetical protein BKA62DRAFT_406656 [Auriculariales sp. MPI-PUGE-AT-0066]|nr:hypothetical protein BKA62DRAFT_406656 [Auriculariales sp. MPI-PUGE-AT-0066]